MKDLQLQLQCLSVAGKTDDGKVVGTPQSKGGSVDWVASFWLPGMCKYCSAKHGAIGSCSVNFQQYSQFGVNVMMIRIRVANHENHGRE